jgi:CheY-like chemotaxis protein
MLEKKVLIAEDDVIMLKTLGQFLSSNGYIVETAVNGSEALKKYKINPAQVVITDIDMPVMDGNEFISNLVSMENPPVIFVTTIERSPELIIDIMKKGIYDYILKPVDMSDLLLKLSRAFETSEMKHALEITRKEKVIRLENNLEWYKFEERLKNRDDKSMGANIFESLLTSFNQGAGFGALVTLMAVMESTAKKDGDDYKISGELFEMIRGNVRAAERALQTFSDMMKIVTEKHKSEKISLSALHGKVADKISIMADMTSVKNHHVMLSDKKDFFGGLYTEINVNYFLQAVEEIILNAMKYSPASSDIIVLFMSQKDKFTISVINDIITNEKGLKGIPMGYENLVFEPFYRLTKTVNDGYHTLDYGLGLTLVEKIVTKHGGSIAINNITDHSDIKAGPKIKVECSMVFNVSAGS